MRLDKFLADNLALSRKEVQRTIKRGEITVDGTLQLKGDIQITDSNSVCIGNQPVILLRDGYWMLHKPTGYICANTDTHHPTVIDILPKDLRERYRKKNLQIVGRLDTDTTGLLLITSNGQWNHRITSPNNQCYKSYNVKLKHPLTDEACQLLEQGVLLHGEKKITRPAKIKKYSTHDCQITICEGKYHQVKRMFAAASNRVDSLHRVSIGDIKLDDNLMPGEFRDLHPAEINSVTG